MSVINQMLRDLEARRERKANSSHYIDEVNIIAHSKSSVYRWLLPAFVILLLSISVFIYTTYTQSELEPEPELAQTAVADLPVKLPDDINQLNKDEINISVPTSQEERLANSEAQLIPDKIPAVSESKDVELQNNINKNQPAKASVSAHKPLNSKVPEPVVNKTIAQNKVLKHKKINKKSTQKNSIVKAKTKTKTKTKTKKRLKQQETPLPISETKKTTVKIEPVRKNKTADKTRTVMSRARVLMASDIASAVKILEDNLKAVKENADYYSLLANLYQRQQRYDEAIVYYRKALLIKPEQGELWIGIALAYRSNGEYDNEQQAFQQALQSRSIRAELRQYAAQQLKRNTARQ